MSTPTGHNQLWKNCTWQNKDEKMAFFNHYFKNSEMVTNHMKNTINAIKQRLITFIEGGKIKEGDKERPITLQDLMKRINDI